MKKLIIGFAAITVITVLLIGVYFSPVGNYFLKNYVKEKLCFINKFDVTYFNHSLNSFSMTLKNKGGYVQILGTFIPFSLSYNANFNNIETLIDFLKGNFESTGAISNEKKQIKIKGDYIFAKGYGNLELKCNNNDITGVIDGKNFNTKIFLESIKGFKFPLFNSIPLNGSNDLHLIIKKYPQLISNFNGVVKINEFQFPIKSSIKLNFINKKDFAFNSYIFSSKISGKITGLKNNKSVDLTGNLKKFDLTLLRKNLLYPITGFVSIKFKYNDQSEILTFKSDYFNGYSDGENINIQINMPLKKFFEFLDIPYLLKGKISGNIVINKNQGIFNLLVEDASFIPNKTIKKLDSIIHYKLEKTKSIFFLNGSFDNQKIVFDFISKNPNYYIYLKKGIYYYEGLYNFNFDLKTKKSFYKFNITNSQIKLIEQRKRGNNYNILVY